MSSKPSMPSGGPDQVDTAETASDPKRAARRHRGDIMSPEKRSALMAKIKGRNTGPELIVATMLSHAGISFETHAKDLPGRPDIVVRELWLVVLVDGDFWHGWRFSAWRDKLSEAWEAKIENTRRRDARNTRRLRRQGWVVVRLWEHQIRKDPSACLSRIQLALAKQKTRSPELPSH